MIRNKEEGTGLFALPLAKLFLFQGNDDTGSDIVVSFCRKAMQQKSGSPLAKSEKICYIIMEFDFLRKEM